MTKSKYQYYIFMFSSAGVFNWLAGLTLAFGLTHVLGTMTDELLPSQPIFLLYVLFQYRWLKPPAFSR
jgi:hypothetical protein